MQTKLVLTTLSLALLCSSSAFGMMPRLGGAALRRAVGQTGRPALVLSMRQLPGKGATPRSFSSTCQLCEMRETVEKEKQKTRVLLRAVAEKHLSEQELEQVRKDHKGLTTEGFGLDLSDPNDWDYEKREAHEEIYDNILCQELEFRKK